MEALGGPWGPLGALGALGGSWDLGNALETSFSHWALAKTMSGSLGKYLQVLEENPIALHLFLMLALLEQARCFVSINNSKQTLFTSTFENKTSTSQTKPKTMRCIVKTLKPSATEYKISEHFLNNRKDYERRLWCRDSQ